MTSVGWSLPGIGSWKISRFITRVSSTTQKIRPTDRKYQLIST